MNRCFRSIVRVAVVAFGIAITAASLPLTSEAKIRLRSQINPSCGTSSSLKFADIYADGNTAVVGSYDCRGAFIFDVSNPDAPVLRSWYNPGANIQFLEAIVIGNRGYFGSGGPSASNEGVHIVDLTDLSNPVLLGKVNSITGGGYPTIHEMMVFDHGGARYLLENSNTTSNRPLRIIDVTNPAQPVLKWTFSSTEGGWVHAMHIRGNRLYLSGFTSTSRIDIYDITNLASQAPALLGSVAVGAGNNHSAWTNETGEYLYSARELSNGDLRVYDVRNPAQPLLIRSIRAADLNINAITPHNPVVMGNKLYVAWYQAGLQVFDISDPTNPIRSGQYDTYQREFAPSDDELRTVENAEPWDIFCGSNRLGESLPTSYGGNWAVYPFLGETKVLSGDMATGLYVIDVSTPSTNGVADFDGDRKTDYAAFSPSSGNWSIEQSSTGTSLGGPWGSSTDIIQPGDYDGDGKSDYAVWRPSDGTWYVLTTTGQTRVIQWGQASDVPVSADFDADGRTDVAVWRPSNGNWYILRSTLGVQIVQWGASGDKPLTGDYEGDGKPDFAIWRPSNGTWYVLRSSSSQPIVATWGISGDKPLLADFDGDGKSDIAAYRPSNGSWYIINSSNNSLGIYNFGLSQDIPLPSDFDGDGKADVAVYRPDVSTWYRINSSDGLFVERSFGQVGDKAVPSSVQPN